MYRVVKRMLDILVVILTLPIQLVAALVIAPLIWCEDRGPIFYISERRGKDGRPFWMYKYRSMKVGAPPVRGADHSLLTGSNDPRVTRIGRVLRSTSLDELPQLINVFKGDMSLIGPRPDVNGRTYSELSSIEQARLTVRPGVTGYAQAYFRNSITSAEKHRWDLYYIEHMSFLLDLKVLWKTVCVVFTRRHVNAPVNLVESRTSNSKDSVGI